MIWALLWLVFALFGLWLVIRMCQNAPFYADDPEELDDDALDSVGTTGARAQADHERVVLHRGVADREKS